MSVARCIVGVAVIATIGACAGNTSGGSDCGPAAATVERVIDGDTIVITGGVKIRYLLLDAPETTDGHHDCFGANASQFNSDLVLGKTIQLTYDAQCTDSYGRTLAYVSVDGTDVNRSLLDRGYACFLHIPPDGDSRADDFAAVAADAKASRRGLWGACDPIPCD